MTTRRLVLLRHGQTEHNADSRMQGQLDTELSALGRRQAEAAAEVIAAMNPRLLVSSDLRRAHDTFGLDAVIPMYEAVYESVLAQENVAA